MLQQDDCLLSSLRFGPERRRMGCREGGAKFCVKYGCVGCHTFTSIGEPVGHRCCIPFEHDLALDDSKPPYERI